MLDLEGIKDEKIHRIPTCTLSVKKPKHISLVIGRMMNYVFHPISQGKRRGRDYKPKTQLVKAQL